ncbi:MAG: antitoxin [Candidatus Omnitrophota bacterium]|jgi:hypothetical protein|nr:MAG: antitoxin [Candidatus Omnitrophota bacterium]
MNVSVELLKADIRDEMVKLERLEREFLQVENKLQPAASDVSNYDRAAIGYYLHNFYNGCETIFLAIARFFENDLAKHSWHTNLLKRMMLEIPEIRPSVIDEELYVLLDDFRGFRHKFRHSYTVELDWERERIVALKFTKTLQLFREQIERFLHSLDKIGE